jgi:hypothetical protein
MMVSPSSKDECVLQLGLAIGEVGFYSTSMIAWACFLLWH